MSVRTPIGQMALREKLDLQVPSPAVESYVVPGARRTEFAGRRIVEYYRPQYQPEDTIAGHLKFALRYEPLDLGVIVATMMKIDGAEIEAWVLREPTGAFSRRAWYLYEHFTGRTLDLEPAQSVRYVEVLDPDKHLVGEGRYSSRHRVIDNMLGEPGLCPTIRRTPRLEAFVASHIDQEAYRLTEEYDAETLARAVNYLYTKETRSSFALEGERPSANRAERFISALRGALSFDPTSKAALVDLQSAIVEPRYAMTDWRDFQNYVGETIGGYREKIHFVCPKPDDVTSLMDAWMAMTRRLLAGTLDPVAAASLIAFAFVFIHPFEDGNGRIHRFLVHHVLARRKFSPPGVIFPVSAAIVRERHKYDEALETFSKAIADYIDYTLTPDQEVDVHNQTAHLYRYFDATPLVEYLYDRVIDTVRHDLKLELGYMATYDRALEAVREQIDMPDKRASLFVQLCLQNKGRLSNAKRDRFRELNDDEVAALEEAVQAAMQAERDQHPEQAGLADAD
jgi:tetratricopeptide (TPR) repeat protein